MKKKSRLLSLIVSLAMVITLTATPVYAESEGETTAVAEVYDTSGNCVGSYNTLKTAYAAVADGGKMVLTANVSDEQLGASSDKAVTLDLNGHTISRATGSVIDSSKGTLTIIDSSEAGTGMVKNSGGAAVKLTGGNVVLESGTLESTYSYAITLSNGALTVNGGAVIAASSANCIVYYTNGTLTINGGLFTVVNRASDVIESGVTSGAIVNAGSSVTAGESVQVAITGGVFQTYRPLLGTSINLEITGGYFLSKYSLKNYIPDGYGYTSGNSCTYLGYTYSSYYQVAHINFTLAVTSGETTETSYYTTLVQAVNAAISAYSSNNGATITITLNNDYETGKVPVESAVVFTLDLNGYTLTSTDKGAFKINNSGAVVTITDNSEAGTGTITTVGSDSVTSSTTGLLQVVNGMLDITGGYYNQNAGSSVFVVSSGGRVSVSGGYFTSDPSDYVADGYVAVGITDSTYQYRVTEGVYLGISTDSSKTVPAEIASGEGESTMYVKVSASDISSNYSTSAYPTTSLTYTDSSNKEHNYIFAGWYSYEGGIYTAMTFFPTGEAYAKFVDADVLKVVCVYTPYSTGSYDAWRFFSSIDSLNYNNFYFVVDRTEQNATTYYTSYKVDSVNHEFVPSEISGSSSYIMTYGIHDTSKVTSHTVQACYVTMDGTKVYGAETVFNVGSITTATVLGL